MITAKRIDQLAIDRNELKAKREELDKELEELDKQILACIEEQGELAERASKTRVVPGQLWELRATYGEETRIDQKAARAFIEACQPCFAELVFRREEKLVLLQTPDRLPGGADLPIATRRLFQAAVQVKSRTPRIDVKSLLAAQSAQAG
jgi:hypothetical protein